MGHIYRTMKKSCAICQPHKYGWAPKHTARERDLERADMQDADQALSDMRFDEKMAAHVDFEAENGLLGSELGILSHQAPIEGHLPP